MHRFAPLLLIATLLAPAPLLAQEPAGPGPLRDCRALLKSVGKDVSRSPDTLAEAVTGGCRFTHVGIVLEEIIEYRADEVILLSPNLLDVFPTGKVFDSADLTIRGLRILPMTGNPVNDYLMKMHGFALDIQLAYETHPEALTAHLSRFSVDAGDIGRITLHARFSQFDNSDLEFSRLADEIGIVHELGLALEDNGLFATIALPLALDGLPYDEDPRPAIAAHKIAISMAIRALPETLLTSVSAESLVRFVTAFPEPFGSWTFHFASDEGLPIAALGAPSLDEVMTILPDDARITASAYYSGPR